MTSTYNTYTARISGPTRLDQILGKDFAPKLLQDIEDVFPRLAEIQTRYCQLMKDYAVRFDQIEHGRGVNVLLSEATTRIDRIFKDFAARREYFTLVFFGAVSAGKTSMICDLVSLDPPELTKLFERSPGFVSGDEVSIGGSVTTKHLYEILLERSKVRLVDVPGIGGVAHDNKTLAPFVDMADCIVFLLDAHRDITEDDYHFLYDNVAFLGRDDTTDGKTTDFVSQKGKDKRVLVVFNKWHDQFESASAAEEEMEFDKKREWVLNGGKDLKFRGVAGLFSKQPEVVRTNTAKRSTMDNYKPYPGQEKKLKFDEFGETLRTLLQYEGTVLRLERPRQVLERDITRVCQELIKVKAEICSDTLLRQLGEVGQRIEDRRVTMKFELDTRVDRLTRDICEDLERQLTKAMREWKPKAGFVDSVKGMIPNWGPDDWNLGKENLKETLKAKWGREISQLLKNKLDMEPISGHVKTEAEQIATYLTSSFLHELSALSPQSRQVIPALKPESSGGEVSQASLARILQQQMEELSGKVRNSLVDDIISIILTDVVLGVLLGALLTPIGSAMLMAGRRMLRGKAKARELRDGIDGAVVGAMHEVKKEIHNKLMEQVDGATVKALTAVQSIVQADEAKYKVPADMIDKLCAELKNLVARLSANAAAA